MKLPNRVHHYLGFYIAILCIVLAAYNYEKTMYSALLGAACAFNIVAALVHCNRDNINFLHKEIRKGKKDD
jgi:hypothetical protein